ncbi:MAG: aspartate 1-decarboxylase [Planctomycetes bacterium]|nr:aspartate 1-decarboxylase [Planctomycetota bacterium]NUQ34387.1 aspartate 1-decarboxylase [Planctomycetaceae bacterium]
MHITVLQGKIHHAVVTAKDLGYHGSLTVDEDLLEQAGLLVGQQIQVYNGNNGARFETYLIRGRRGSGEMQVNGPASRLVEVGDTIVVAAFAQMTPDEAKRFTPKVVICDRDNRVLETIVY